MIKKLMKRYEQDLKRRNDVYEAGNEEALDDLHETFKVTVNGTIISLGSMDTYGAFCKFLDQADADEAYLGQVQCLIPSERKLRNKVDTVKEFLDYTYKCINTDIDYTVSIRVKDKTLIAYDNAQLMSDLVKALENYKSDIE